MFSDLPFFWWWHGSGLTSLVMERLSVDYGKKSKLEPTVIGEIRTGTCKQLFHPKMSIKQLLPLRQTVQFILWMEEGEFSEAREDLRHWRILRLFLCLSEEESLMSIKQSRFSSLRLEMDGFSHALKVDLELTVIG
ncbi:hypothetical protein ACQ4LE_005838 [Meloidogyne hapla]